MDDIRSILSSVIQKLEDPEKLKKSLLTKEWKNIAGERLAKHTTPQLSSKGILYVRVDESVLAFEISQKYRQSLLKRAQAILGEETVRAVKVLVGQ